MRASAEILIENDARPVAILHATEPVPRTISECIALLPEDSTAIIDPDFSKDVAKAIESHRAPRLLVAACLYRVLQRGVHEFKIQKFKRERTEQK